MTIPEELSIETGPGTYALVLYAAQPAWIKAGVLGLLQIQPGCYIYSGSALGPGGLRARLNRHLHSSVQHWHIDYIKPHAPIHEIWYCLDPQRLEHQWANALANLPGASLPWPRFGASDCRCPAHLVYFEQPPDFHQILSRFSQAFVSNKKSLLRQIITR